MTCVQRSSRAGVEDRWHRGARRGEQVPWPADLATAGAWCTDPKHGDPGTQVTTARHGRGRRWLARWVDNDGQERSKSFDRKAEAQAQTNHVTTALTTGNYADPRRAATTFATVAQEWLASKSSRNLKPKTVAGYRGLLDVVVLPKWGDVRLREIDHAGIQAWVTWLASDPAARQRPMKTASGDCTAKGLSPARVIQAFQVLDQVLRYAVRSRYIANNPADDVEQPRKASREDIALSHEEVHRLADAREDISTMVYLLAYGGMRYGELAALCVSDIDLQRKRIRVSRSVTYVAGNGYVEGTTKTHQTRTIPILTKRLADALDEAICDRNSAEYVFPYHDGGPVPLDWFRYRFDQAAAIACLTGITPKTLRHTAGSLALALGASVVTVSKLLGHGNVTTTLNVYSHLLPDDFDNLAVAMEQATVAIVGP